MLSTVITITPLSLSWCYTEFGQGRGTLRNNPLSLSWCYTEFGQGRGTLRSNPLSLCWCYTEFGQGRAAGLGDVTIKQVCHFQARNTPVPFLVLQRVRAGEGCGFLGEMTIEQVWHFQPQSTPVPFLVLHRVRAGEGCRVAHMLVNVTQSLSCCSLVTLASDVLQRALLSSAPVSSPWFVASKLEGSRASAW